MVASPKMRAVWDMIDRVAPSILPVLVQGETGTGKEVVARALHARSTRKDGPLRSVNCAAIPPSLVESVLFGHEKGAFIGAERTTKGLFEQAHGGTLMLDEVGELPAAAQAALLRVLETTVSPSRCPRSASGPRRSARSSIRSCATPAATTRARFAASTTKR